MKIFLGTPITGIVQKRGEETVSEQNYMSLCRILKDLRSAGHQVFCALEEENFGKTSVTSEFCTKRDFDYMKEHDVYVVFPNNSYGCAVELGWASALKKPIYIGINSSIGSKTPLYEGLTAISENVHVMEYESKHGFPADGVWGEVLDDLNRFISTIDNEESEMRFIS